MRGSSLELCNANSELRCQREVLDACSDRQSLAMSSMSYKTMAKKKKSLGFGFRGFGASSSKNSKTIKQEKVKSIPVKKEKKKSGGFFSSLFSVFSKKSK